jgi:hypothetical protein
MAGPIRTPGINDLRAINKELGDITGKLDRISQLGTEKWSFKNIAALGEGMRDLKRELEDLGEEKRELEVLAASGHDVSRALEDVATRTRIVNRAMKDMKVTANDLTRAVGGGLLRTFDRFGKRLIGLGLETFTLGLKELSKSIYRIWEVQERWTRVMGGFNKQVGAASAGMRSANSMAAEWASTVRGLGGSLEEGASMAAQFINEFDRMPLDKKTAEGRRFSKMMLGLARGFDLGGEGAGKFADLVSTYGTKNGEALENAYGIDGKINQKAVKQYREIEGFAANTFRTIADGALAAGVPANKFFKDFLKNKEFMAEWGKEGVKVMTNVMVYAKRLGVSMQSIQKFMDQTDTFDNAAKAAAKLNTVFGTTINSLELMLEQDPSKRFEMVRREMLQQGKDMTNLSRLERKIIAETMGLSVEEVNKFLRTGKTLEEFQKDQEKAAERKERAESMIRKAMAKTAQTMFSFEAAWEKIWKAVSKLIKPFTDLIGLTKAGGKETKSFGQVMSAVFGRFEKFILDIAGNREWQMFMKRLASDFQSLVKRVSDMAKGDTLSKWIKTVVKAGNDFYDIMKKAFEVIVDVGRKAMPIVKFIAENIKPILALWAGAKIGGMALGGAAMLRGAGLIGGGATAATGAAGAAAAGAGAMGKFGGAALAGGLGAAAGGAVGSAFGAGTGGAIGGGAGGIVGMIVGGPIGAAVGAALGSAIGIVAQKWLKSDSAKELEATQKKMADVQKLRGVQEQFVVEKQRQRLAKEQEADTVVSDLNKSMGKAKEMVTDFSSKEKEALAERIGKMHELGLGGDELLKIWGKLTTADGPLYLTSEELKILTDASNAYSQSLSKLNEDTIKYIEKQKNDLENGNKFTELEIKKNDLEKRDSLERRKAELEREKDQLTFWDKFKGMASSKFSKVILEQIKIKNEEKKLQEETNKKLLKLNKERLLKEFEFSKNLKLIESKEFTAFNTENQGKFATLEDALAAFKNTPMAKAVLSNKTADGGIAFGPQSRLVGEAGPEAIVPLKALAGTGDSPTAATVGATVAERIVNFASGRSRGGSNTKKVVIEVPISLDSTVVARAMATALLTEYEAAG